MNEPPTTEVNASMQTFGRKEPEPGAYTIDLSVVQDVPLQMNGQPSTFGEAYCKLRDSKIKEIPSSSFDRKYITEGGEIILDGSDWALSSAMREFAELFARGIDPYRVTWFYYAHDVSSDADELYTFFAIHDGRVVLESCSFGVDEPLVLKRKLSKDVIWRSEPYFNEAFEAYWYRKFYTETLTGQLMVLRSDKPALYHHERPHARDIIRETQLYASLKTYRLVWVAIPLLVALVFPATRYYMAVAAGLALAEALRLSWATRKLGR